jgi:FlaA1/EpsC-like NDP-sugar epimerase
VRFRDFFQQKKVLVTGSCGTVGSELVRQLLEHYEVEELVAVDNNESELFFLEQRFSKQSNTYFSLADVRDRDRLADLMKDIDIVFHTAAFKHVTLCEKAPLEAVQTNIMGVQNVVSAAIQNRVEKVVFTSSDKAVNPTNVMGTSKLMGERLMTAANNSMRDGQRPVLASTRFGNVMGSRGSVIPVFREQIRAGGPLSLTHPEMTRFIMSIEEAVRLVIDSAYLAKGGEVFITKMPVIRIRDLAAVMIQECAPMYGYEPESIEIKVVGVYPGEKMYEELMNHEETRRAWELSHYFVVLPAFPSLYRNIDYDYPDLVSKEVDNPYNSSNEPFLTKDELAMFLRVNRLLDEPAIPRHPPERHWPVGPTAKSME